MSSLKIDDELKSTISAPTVSHQLIGINVGPGRLIPDLKLKLRYDDNLTLDNSNQISSFVGVLSPHAVYVVSERTRKFIIDYLIEAGFHEASSIDDYVDNRIRAAFDYEPTSRFNATLHSEFLDAHDARGTGRALGGTGQIQTSPDEWHHWGIGGKLAYGARTAIGRIEADAGYVMKKYDNNRAGTSDRDLDNIYGAARFFYRFRPKTYFLLEGRTTSFDYDNDIPGTPSLDSITSRVLGGVTWFATYKTTGFLKLGYVEKDFDSVRRIDDDSLSWEVGVDWKPRSYSIFHFETAQDFTETNGTGDAIDRRHMLMSWQHSWKERFSTSLDLLYANETFEPTSRDDDILRFGAGANYEMRRWLTFGARYRYQERDSNVNRFNHDQNIFELSADITL